MLSAIYSKLIPQQYKANIITYSHSKNLINTGIVSLILSPVFAGVYYYVGFHLASLVIMAFGMALIACVLSIQFFPLYITRNLTVTPLYLCLVWLTFSLGGIISAPSYWLILPPLLVIIFGGILSGFIWTLISLFTIIIFFALEKAHYPMPESPVINHLFLQEMSVCGLIIAIYCLTYYSEKGKRDDAKKIQEINKQLISSNEKINFLFKKAIEANVLKSEFLANMSHELHNPINAIVGFTELMKNKKISSDQYDEYFDDILSSANHLLQMVTDMLDISKLDFGIHKIQPEDVNLTLLVNNIKDIFHHIINEKNLTIKIDVDKKLNTVHTDPLRLKQILFHTISNAIKFTPNNGSIEVRIFPVNKDHFRIEVTDTGIGIRKDDLDKLFKPFQQLDGSMAKKYPGTGTGLALVHRIVQALRGEIGVNSTLGKGSLFYVILPSE